jgi:signal transduction histidine kinase
MMCLLIPIHGESGGRGLLLIQSSLDAALRPYTNIQRALAVIGILGFLAAVLGSMIVAGGITQPLQRIAHAALGLMQGDWSQRAPVVLRDEVGLLAETFNRMAERLESWDSDMRSAVAERTRELDAAVAQLDAAFQLMRQFNADASHELRTPLTVIRGEAEVALRANRSAPEYEAVLRTIQTETEHMSRIIEQLLLLARADSGELRLERRRVALDDVVREVAHRAEVLAKARQIRLITEGLEPLFVEGDEDQLRRLTLNLVDNAIKYTPEGGEVHVRLGSHQSEGAGTPHEAVLEVADTGIGIDADDLSRIFDRFFRVDKSRSRAQGGSGLGLAICQWIVEGHGGRIEVRSQPGTGTRFVVRLPMETGISGDVLTVEPAGADDWPRSETETRSVISG